MRRIARIALRVVAGLVVVVVVLVALLQTPWGKSFVRGRIEAKLGHAVNGHVTLGSVDYGILFGHVELKDLAIRDRDDRDDPPALAIASVHVALDRGSLLRGAPVIDELAIDGLVANIVQTGDGATNLAGLFKPSGSPPPASIRVTKLHLDGSASITRSDGTMLTVSDLAIEGAASAQPAQQIVDATLARVAAKVTIARPGAPPRQLDLAIHSVALARRGGSVEATIDELAFGALSVGSIHAKLGLVATKLDGVQTITIAKGRIARDKLSTMLGKQVLVDDVTFDASLSGPPAKLVAHGSVVTRQTSLTLDGTVDLGEPARPGYDVVLVGKGASEDLISGTPLGMPEIQTDVRLAVVGTGIVPPDLDAKITLDVGPTHVGAIEVDSVSMLALARRGGITLDHFIAHGLGFEIAASGDIESDTTLHGTLTVTGNPPEALRVLRAAGIAVWYRVPPILHLAVTVTATGKLDGELALVVEPMQLSLAGGRVEMAATATLDHHAVRDAKTTIKLSHLDLGGLARLAHKPAPKVSGSLSGTVTLSRTARSHGATYDVAVALREPAVVAQIHGNADMTVADAHARIVRPADHATLATITAHVAHDDQGLLPQRGWHVVVDAPARSLAELAQLAPPELAAKLHVPDGDLALHADLTGTPAQPRGTIDATIHVATPAGPQTVVLHSAITPSPRGVTVTTHGQGGDLATIESVANVPSLFVGRELAIATLKRSITANATIDVPDHELATLPLVSPAIARLGGMVGGHIEVTGAPAAPQIAARLRWHGYALAGGGTGETTLELAGTPEHVVAKLAHGPIAITADVTHAGEHVAIVAHMHADPTPFVPLLPAAIVPDLHGADLGKLAWNMTARVALAQHGKQFALEDVNLDGMLAIRGGSFEYRDRAWHDLELELTGDPDGVRLTKLAAHESDEQVADRSLEVSGLVTIVKTKHDDGSITLAPAKGELAIALHDWLALGSGSPLLSDAPTATVNLGAKVTADLTAPILAIDATIDTLDVSVPDRLDRSHQPEKWAVSNDVIFLDETHAPAGALPVPLPPTEARHPVPLDVRIHIPNPVHVQKSPLDLRARGELTVQVRDTRVATRGTLEAVGGKLVLFGRDQPIVDGTLAFTDAHPHGEFALRFARPLPNEVVRELSRPDEPARVTLTGPPAKPNVALGGATNIELDEVLAIYHAGHPVFLTFPGLYPSSTAEVPHGEAFLVFGYLANALPHFLVLDRIAAWADPSEPRGAYGQIRNLEADRYAADRSRRVRVVGRPTVPGRSTAEVQVDHLWLDTGRALVGAGLRAGDRLGGGLALFFEWSSAR
ncbi:MAG: translocation/assembly module TamB domain-containing protein [Kofleriaceae bacterium]